MAVSARCHSGAMTWQPSWDKWPGVRAGPSGDGSPRQQAAAEGRAEQDREVSVWWSRG